MVNYNVNFKKLSDKAVIPEFKHGNGDAACDLVSTENVMLTPYASCMISTGLSMSFDENLVATVCSRSGLAAKHDVFVLNSPGIIDSSYRGEIKVILMNNSDTCYEVKAGDRIAQLMFLPVVHPTFTVVDELSITSRGEGGFGSTGA